MKKYTILHNAVEIWSGKARDENDAFDKAGVELIEDE